MSRVFSAAGRLEASPGLFPVGARPKGRGVTLFGWIKWPPGAPAYGLVSWRTKASDGVYLTTRIAPGSGGTYIRVGASHTSIRWVDIVLPENGDNVWHPVVYVFEEDIGDFRPQTAYTANALFKSSGNGLPYIIDADVESVLYVGQTLEWASGGGAFGTGQVAHVALWDRDLTAEEITLLTDGGGVPSDIPTDLIEYWPMTDGNTGDEIGVVQGTVLTVVDTVGSDANDNPPVGEPTLSITDVNGDNNIVSNGVIAVNGTFPAPVAAASIDGYALTVANQTATTVTLTPFNVFNSTLPFGAGVLTLDDGTTQDTQAITLTPATGTQYVVVAGVQPYLAAGLDVADGDQMACDTAVAGSTMTLSADTDVVYSPAVPDGVVHNRHWYDVTTSTWDSGTVRVDRPGAVANPPVWRATPNPPAASIGVPYSYAIGGLLDGKRPMTLTDVGAALPAGLSYDDSAYPETITGTPTASGAVAGIVTRADNGE